MLDQNIIDILEAQRVADHVLEGAAGYDQGILIVEELGRGEGLVGEEDSLGRQGLEEEQGGEQGEW